MGKVYTEEQLNKLSVEVEKVFSNCKAKVFGSDGKVQILNMEEEQMKETKPATPTKYAGLGAAIAVKLMIGFWFGVGVMLAIGVADCLNYCIGEIMRNK